MKPCEYLERCIHLLLQTDALRQDLSKQRDLYKARADAAEKLSQPKGRRSNAMRRILGNRALSQQS